MSHFSTCHPFTLVFRPPLPLPVLVAVAVRCHSAASRSPRPHLSPRPLPTDSLRLFPRARHKALAPGSATRLISSSMPLSHLPCRLFRQMLQHLRHLLPCSAALVASPNAAWAPPPLMQLPLPLRRPREPRINSNSSTSNNTNSACLPVLRLPCPAPCRLVVALPASSPARLQLPVAQAALLLQRPPPPPRLPRRLLLPPLVG